MAHDTGKPAARRGLAWYPDFSNTRLDRCRPLTSYAKVQALVGALIRNRRAFANLKAPGCYLDLGCGPNSSPDFCNLDYAWRPGVDVCWDVTGGLPFADAYVAGIFTEHLIEHLAFKDALALLKECRRILHPGGVLRIVVPAAEIYLSEYARHRAGKPARMPYGDQDAAEFGIAAPIVSVNRIFRAHGHQFIWDYESLRAVLRANGFANVARCQLGQGRDPRLLRDSPHRRDESLYVEAV